MVFTADGAVRGELSADGETIAFRGIPFAAPPVGMLRWRAPQPTSTWSGMRDCFRFGATAIQRTPQGSQNFPFNEEPRDENCLFLNVWASTSASDGPRPVIVWLHLGAFRAGSGSAPLYDGENWAKAGVVFVSLNYRLGKLGFLAHPSLRVEPDNRPFGNYGFLDQIAALRWVRQNIAAFGGDPNCVTIYGVSSGASSVSLLMTSPEARRLFHRAIAESGGSFGPVARSSGIGDQWQDLQSASASSTTWANAIGAPSRIELLTLNAHRFCALADEAIDGLSVFDASRPIIDREIILEGSYSAFEHSRQAPVPLLIGSAADETSIVVHPATPSGTHIHQAELAYGSLTARFLELYSDKAQPVPSAVRAAGHRLFAWQSWTWAKLHALAGNRVFYYRFEQAPPGPSRTAFHGASIYYTFNRFCLQPEWRWSEADRDLSATLVTAWTHFARTGRPWAPKLPDWPRLEPKNPRLMVLSGSPEVVAVADLDHLRFWDDFYGHKRRRQSLDLSEG